MTAEKQQAKSGIPKSPMEQLVDFTLREKKGCVVASFCEFLPAWNVRGLTVG
jgi:hypothetical protein